MVSPKKPFVIYRILSFLIRTIIKEMCMFISKLKLFSIKTKLLFHFCFYHLSEACFYHQGDITSFKVNSINRGVVSCRE